MTYSVKKNAIPLNLITSYVEDISELNRYFNELPTEKTLSGRVYDMANTLPNKYRFLDPILPYVEEFLQSKRFFASGWQLRLDLPSNTTELLSWHRDCDYFQEFPTSGLVAWIPLTDISIDSGGIEVASGVFDQYSFTPINKIYEHPGRKPHNVWEVDLADVVGERIICSAGDLVLFDLLTPHRSIANRSQSTRITLQIRFFTFDKNIELHRALIESR